MDAGRATDFVRRKGLIQVANCRKTWNRAPALVVIARPVNITGD